MKSFASHVIVIACWISQSGRREGSSAAKGHLRSYPSVPNAGRNGARRLAWLERRVHNYCFVPGLLMIR
jgi:hypothetical protein